MKNQSMTKTGLKSGSGQKYGNLQSSQTNMQNNSSKVKKGTFFSGLAPLDHVKHCLW